MHAVPKIWYDIYQNKLRNAPNFTINAPHDGAVGSTISPKAQACRTSGSEPEVLRSRVCSAPWDVGFGCERNTKGRTPDLPEPR